MSHRHRSRRHRRGRAAVGLIVAVGLAVGAAACADDGDGSPSEAIESQRAARGAPRLPEGELTAGDCFGAGDQSASTAVEGSTSERAADVRVVPCDVTHAHEVIGIASLEGYQPPDERVPEVRFGESWPGDTAMFLAVRDVCVPLFVDYVGVPYESSSLALQPAGPDPSSWATGDREVVCVVNELGDHGEGVTLRAGSVEGSKR